MAEGENNIFKFIRDKVNVVKAVFNGNKQNQEVQLVKAKEKEEKPVDEVGYDAIAYDKLLADIEARRKIKIGCIWVPSDPIPIPPPPPDPIINEESVFGDVWECPPWEREKREEAAKEKLIAEALAVFTEGLEDLPEEAEKTEEEEIPHVWPVFTHPSSLFLYHNYDLQY